MGERESSEVGEGEGEGGGEGGQVHGAQDELGDLSYFILHGGLEREGCGEGC